jgi:hypothetical protein
MQKATGQKVMEDHKWQTSAEQWESAYKQVKTNRDALEVQLRKICEAAMKVERGCHCEYDHRCYNCDMIVTMHKILDEVTNDSKAR